MLAMKTEFLGRARWLGLLGCLGLVIGYGTEAPPAVSVPGLIGLIGAQTALSVRAEDLRWCKSSGYVVDRLWGRTLLFLGADSPGAPRDLYRARVRLGDSGQPLSLSGVKDLTRTPIGDDAGLDVVGGRVSFATLAFGKVQAVTVLELDGVRSEDRSGGLFADFLRRLTHLQLTGTWSGIGRTDLVFQVPVQQAELALGEKSLLVRIGSSKREIVYDLGERRARAKDGSQAHGVRVVPSRQPPKPFVLWAVDGVREETGPEPIAWLEDKVFGARDLVRRTTFNLTASAESRAMRDPAEAIAATSVTTNPERGRASEAWPPENIPSLWKQVEAHEGIWSAVELPFLRTSLARPAGSKPPPYFYRAFTRPDPKRPYAKVWFVAMDMRQLELNMQAGFEDPVPLTGPAGDGRLPDDKETVERVVATFNGAFKTEHGKYGMMVQKRVLLPPIPGGASVVVDAERNVSLGSWPKGGTIPDELISFRQNLDPLVEEGVANPTGRQLWGWQLEGKSVLTERTALCVTPSGHLYYAWGEEIDGPTLGIALKQAGCNYGMHLDMNPGHCGFTFVRVDDWQKHAFSLQRAVSKMSVPMDRHVRWSPKDFFYVTLRDPLPPSPSVNWQWAPDAGSQPNPTWWPGIFRARTAVGDELVEVTAFEAGRFDWAVRAGTQEPNEPGAPFMKTSLSHEDSARSLAAIGLAYTTRATRLGLAFDGKVSIPMRPKMGTLLIRPGSALKLTVEPSPTLGPTDSAVQLPLLALRGAVTDEGRARGPLRERAALCVTSGKRMLLAKARSDSAAPVVSTLLSLGCSEIVDLDRGSSDPPFLHRSGTDLPPTFDYETSVLYVLSRDMTPHAGRWEMAASTLNANPTGYDTPHRSK